MNKNERKCDNVYQSVQYVLNGLKPYREKSANLLTPFKKGKASKEVKQEVLNLRINSKIAISALLHEASELYSVPIKHIILVGQFDLSNKL